MNFLADEKISAGIILMRVVSEKSSLYAIPFENIR